MLVCPAVLAFSIGHRRIVRRVETCRLDLNKMLVLIGYKALPLLEDHRHGGHDHGKTDGVVPAHWLLEIEDGKH
jgi:hypothetical protein